MSESFERQLEALKKQTEERSDQISYSMKEIEKRSLMNSKNLQDGKSPAGAGSRDSSSMKSPTVKSPKS